MPELPEVECVRRSLQARVLGRRVRAVRVMRADIIAGKHSPAALLRGQRITQILRHGKQLALVGEQGACIAIHLGMSGQLCLVDPTTSQTSPFGLPPHTHVLWTLDAGQALRFTDPRRFGGLWTFGRTDELQAKRWSALGPDALLITPKQLYTRLQATSRALKPALLDQGLVAGLGNIYVDELLHTAGLHPLTPAPAVDAARCRRLVGQMRRLLQGAIGRGGSTLRDYVDALNRPGRQQDRHRVYGRAGQPCKTRGCGALIATEQIAGRTSAWCPGCQKAP